MKRALIVCTVAGFLNFEKNDILLLQEKGYEVHCATNFNIGTMRFENNLIIRHHVDFARSPLSKDNIKAYVQLKKIMKEYHYDIVHCHTPMGGVIARLVALPYRKKECRVIYTAHGFHFYKGAPLKNWLLFYPVEWICSWMTDVLITINMEDYERAKKHLHAEETKYIPGVGINIKKFKTRVIDKDKKRQELGLSEDDKILLSVGELNKNKNHEVVIRAVAKLQNSKIHYFIAGQGILRDYLECLVEELGVEKQVHLLGFRNDVAELLHVADVFVFPSFREGLSVAVMEALASGVPVICSKIRGNIDLVQDKVTGYYIEPLSVNSVETAIANMLDRSPNNIFKEKCIEASYKYDISNISEKMKDIYRR